MLSEPTVLVNVARLVGETLEQDYGIDPAGLFAQVGIDTRKFLKPGARTSFRKMDELWTAARDASGDPWFGFTAGRRATPNDFFVLGHTWQASETLQDAFDRLCRYSHVLTTRRSETTLHKQDDGYALTEVWPEGSAIPTEIAKDAGYVALFGLVDFVTRGAVSPVKVTLTVDPKHASPLYEELFRCPVSYGHETDEWLFATEDIERPLPGSIPDVASATDRIAEKYIASLDVSTVAADVSRMLIQTLPSGHMDQETIAQRLYRSRSTLQRQLSAEGTSYRQILDETRRELAERYLAEGDHSQAQVAFMLGFSDQSNFARAFKRWTGVSPGEYQKAA
jgi:AraC-like DNA-binding protein